MRCYAVNGNRGGKQETRPGMKKTTSECSSSLLGYFLLAIEIFTGRATVHGRQQWCFLHTRKRALVVCVVRAVVVSPEKRTTHMLLLLKRGNGKLVPAGKQHEMWLPRDMVTA